MSLRLFFMEMEMTDQKGLLNEKSSEKKRRMRIHDTSVRY